MLKELLTTVNTYIKNIRNVDDEEQFDSQHYYDIRRIDGIINKAMISIVNNVVLNMLEMTVRITYAQLYEETHLSRVISKDQQHIEQLHKQLNVMYQPYFDGINTYISKQVVQYRLQHHKKLLELHQLFVTGIYWPYNHRLQQTNCEQFLLNKSQMLNVLQKCKEVMISSQNDLSDIHKNIIEKQYRKLLLEYHNEQKISAALASSNSETNTTASTVTILNRCFDEAKEKYANYMNLIRNVILLCDILIQFESTANTNTNKYRWETFVNYYQQQLAKSNESNTTTTTNSSYHLFESEKSLDRNTYRKNYSFYSIMKMLNCKNITNLLKAENDSIVVKEYLNEMADKLEVCYSSQFI